MKPKEFVTKFNLEAKKPLTDDFWKAFIVDFNEALNASKGKETMRGFEVAVSVMKQKWEGILCKSANKYVDTPAWNWFYATAVVPTRTELFPKGKFFD